MVKDKKKHLEQLNILKDEYFNTTSSQIHFNENNIFSKRFIALLKKRSDLLNLFLIKQRKNIKITRNVYKICF